MGRKAKVVLVVIGVALSLAGLAFLGVGFWLSPQSRLQTADAIIAISGGDTTARAQAAIALYKEHWSQHLVFSGAALDPNSASNARVMMGLAEARGVPASAIILDETAVSTEQNAQDVARIARQNGYRGVILVTSPYHQRRASIVFSRALGPGVKVINHSSIDPNWRRSRWWATAYSRQLTLSELQKTAYELVFGS